MNIERSRTEALFETAARLLPGGVSSPVRAYGAVGGVPRFLERGEGAHVYDVEGRRYLDFVMSWGPAILGHAHPEVVEAVRTAVGKGFGFGAPHRLELELAERITSWYPSAERVRFTSSGTEATMSAIRLARGVTGRDRIVKFSGCYHGHGDSLLVAAGSGGATFGVPSSAGVPRALAELTTVLPLDDPERFEHVMSRRGEEVAAVIVEPVPANNGLLLQRRDLLEVLRERTRECGALLIFDEVISGFRLAPGGACERYGITPDLATFGKVIGGGLAVGALAGRAEVMDRLAPLGPVYQAGTLSGNPIAMTAGVATLEVLARENGYETLERRGDGLRRRVQEILARRGLPAAFVGLGSLFWIYLGGPEAPRSAEAIEPQAAPRYARFFHACARRGVMLAPSAYEVGFLSTAHREEDLDRAAEVFDQALEEAFSSEGASR